MWKLKLRNGDSPLCTTCSSDSAQISATGPGICSDALIELREIGEIVICSAVYETQPAGMLSSNPFYNMAVELMTPFNPPRLLHAVKAIEKKLGRTPSTHLKDREIDIDILLYEHLYYEEQELQVPHPHLSERRFALVPLCDVASRVTDPFTGATMEQLMKKCVDTSTVTKTTIILSTSRP
jgi:2-amino-4-hydroxy-6-hydroxymethyldihydropteridine diphosphokinase